MFENIKIILVSIGAIIIGALSFALFKKSRKVEDLYDDLLDTKAELALKKVELKLIDKTKEYNDALKKYTQAILKHNAFDVVFIPESSNTVSSGNKSSDGGDRDFSATLRSGPKSLH